MAPVVRVESQQKQEGCVGRHELHISTDWRPIVRAHGRLEFAKTALADAMATREANRDDRRTVILVHTYGALEKISPTWCLHNAGFLCEFGVNPGNAESPQTVTVYPLYQTNHSDRYW